MDSLPINSSNATNYKAAALNEKFIFNKELNAEFLEQSYSQNLGFGQKMFSIFLGSIEKDMEILTCALRANDYAGIKEIAHKIKNNFTWVGLPNLSKLMNSIENLSLIHI